MIGSERESEIAGQRRRALLEAAFAVIAEKGLEGMRTRDVAARAGVNISTLHYYFGTKDELIMALVEHAGDSFESPARDGQPIPETLTTHLEQNWRVFRSNPELAVVLQELRLRAVRDPAARASVGAMIDEWNDAVEAMLRHGMATGEIRADIDAHATARVCTSFVMGALIQLGVTAKDFDLDAVTRAFERSLAGQPHKHSVKRRRKKAKPK